MVKAIGRLGLSYDDALDAPMHILHAAIDDRHELIRETLEAVFGKPKQVTEDVVKPTEPPAPSPVDIMAAFRAAAS